MKTKINILFAGILALFFAMPSCTDLDEVVYDKIIADDFGKTEAEINSIIGPAYNTLKRYFPNNYLYLSECSGDMALTPTRKGGDWFDGGSYRDLHMHTWTANTNTIKSCWNAATQSISSCNLIYETVNNSGLSDEAKTKALAEIRGVRAFWFYAMLDNWGNIPISADFQNKELPEVKTRKEAYTFIINELNEIKDVLRSDVSSASYGKFTKGSAYALLAKMYLNAEAWGVDSPKWEEVIEACDVVMGLDYILEPDWKANFQVNNETSKEAIFACCFSSQDSENQNNMHKRTLHYKDNIALGGNWSSWNGICAQPDYAELYEAEDKRFDWTFLSGEMKDPATGEVLITAHDRPLIHTISVTLISGSEYAGSTWGQVNQEDGVRCNKWTYDKSTIDAMENDFQLLRLADIYMMKAEALVRLGKDNAEATRLINLVRERAFGNDSQNYTSVTLKEIALERKLELAWECYSRQDNIRFGTFQDARWLKTSTAGKDYLNLYPIPVEAWQANNKLVQNPGYPAF